MVLSRFVFIFALIFEILYGFQSLAIESGYINDIKTEKEQHYTEIFLISDPIPKIPSLHDRIFNPELTKEFHIKYMEQFGNIDTDSLTYRDPRYAEIYDNSASGVNINSDPTSIAARKTFGEYMVKRLTEWHVDHYIKEDPQMRPVYEVKEAISHAEVKINPETKLNLEYSLAGNALDVKFINSYLESKVTIYMDPGAFGPSTNTENKLFLSKQIDKKTKLSLTATSNDGIASFEVLRAIKGNMSANLLESTHFKDQGLSPRETRSTVGFSNSF